MIHSVEGDDIQPTDDTDYTKPFGVPEEKAESLGFKDPAVMNAAIKRLTRKYYPPWYLRLERWLRRHLFRMKR